MPVERPQESQRGRQASRGCDGRQRIQGQRPYISPTTAHPSHFWLAMKASQASRWASRELKSCFQPFLAALAGIDHATKFCRGTIGAGRRSISHGPTPPHRATSRIRAQLAIRCMLADHAEEAGSGPVRPGDGMCDLRQRWKGFSGVFKAVFHHDHRVRPAAPLPYQPRARPVGRIGRRCRH